MSTTLEVRWFLTKSGIIEVLDPDRMTEAIKAFHNHFFGRWMDYRHYDEEEVGTVLKDFLD